MGLILKIWVLGLRFGIGFENLGLGLIFKICDLRLGFGIHLDKIQGSQIAHPWSELIIDDKKSSPYLFIMLNAIEIFVGFQMVTVPNLSLTEFCIGTVAICETSITY